MGVLPPANYSVQSIREGMNKNIAGARSYKCIHKQPGWRSQLWLVHKMPLTNATHSAFNNETSLLQCVSVFSLLQRSLPEEFMEEISLSITKHNIHAMIIIGGFEVRWYIGEIAAWTLKHTM